VRRKITGTSERPRLTVSKSLRNMTAQLIDDLNGRTIAYWSTQSPGAKAAEEKMTKTAAARAVGKKLAELAAEKGVKRVVFDRNHYLYHGRIKAVADGAREGGLEF
jgi:large subunit ribosomal protein L18